jgi:hypothetical protein
MIVFLSVHIHIFSNSTLAVLPEHVDQFPSKEARGRLGRRGKNLKLQLLNSSIVSLI